MVRTKKTKRERQSTRVRDGRKNFSTAQADSVTRCAFASPCNLSNRLGVEQQQKSLFVDFHEECDCRRLRENAMSMHLCTDCIASSEPRNGIPSLHCIMAKFDIAPYAVRLFTWWTPRACLIPFARHSGFVHSFSTALAVGSLVNTLRKHHTQDTMLETGLDQLLVDTGGEGEAANEFPAAPF